MSDTSEQSKGGYPQPRNARFTLVALAFLGFFVTTDLTLTSLLIEPMKQDLALTDVQIGLLQGTVFGLAFGLGSIPLGRLIDRANRVRLLGAGLLIWILALGITAFAGGMTLLVVGRIGLGLVAAMIIPASISIISDLYPPERRSVATSIFAAGQATGQAFGILAGGLAFDALTRASEGGLPMQLEPWRLLYLAAAALGLLLLLMVAMLREPARMEQRQDARSVGQAIRELWSHRPFLLPLLLAILFSAITIQAASVWATPVLMRSYGLTPGQFAGWLSVALLAGGILGALAGGQAGELGRRHAGRAGVLVPALVAAFASVPLAFFAVAPSIPVFGVMLGLNIFFGAMIATLAVVSITLNIPNEVRGLALGANVFVTAVFGAAIGPAAIGLASNLLGGEDMLGQAIAVVCAPSSLLAAFLFALAMRGAPANVARSARA